MTGSTNRHLKGASLKKHIESEAQFLNNSSSNISSPLNKPVDSPNYKLRPNDFIRLDIFQEPDLTVEMQVSADGFINLHHAGALHVAGLTISQAQMAIVERYQTRNVLKRPQVNLIVSKPVERKIKVLGQVNSPGDVPIPAHKEFLLLTDVLSAAKGWNLRANLSAVQVTSNALGQEKTTRSYNLKKILKSPQSEDIPIHDGDVVLVPESIL